MVKIAAQPNAALTTPFQAAAIGDALAVDAGLGLLTLPVTPAAVLSICRGRNADAAALDVSPTAVDFTITAGADLIGLAGIATGPAVGLVPVGIHARAATLRKVGAVVHTEPQIAKLLRTARHLTLATVFRVGLEVGALTIA
jgi:hypothetical protein